MSGFSVHWNAKRGQFIGKFKKPDGTWGTKYVPKGQFHAGQEAEARRWLIVFYAGVLSGETPNNKAVKVGAKTLSHYGPVWLQMREDRRTLSPNYLKALRSNMNGWILDNEDHPHASIQELNMEKDFAPSVCLKWIDSLQDGLDVGSVRQVVGTIRNCFHDLIAREILDPAMVNPFDRPAVVERMKDLRKLHKRQHVITVMSKEQVITLLTAPEEKVPALRKVRYTFTMATMARDMECQGVTFENLILDATIPHVYINVQLYKPGLAPPLVLEDERKRRSRKSDLEIAKTEKAIVMDPKFGARRVLPLHPYAVQVLKWWKRIGWKLTVGRNPLPSDPVFPRDRKSPRPGTYSAPQSAELFRKDLASLGLPLEYKGKPLVFHSLRHTGASLLEAHGVSEAQIGIMMGHKPETVTRESYLATQLPTWSKLINLMPLPEPSLTQGKSAEFLNFPGTVVSSANTAEGES